MWGFYFKLCAAWLWLFMVSDRPGFMHMARPNQRYPNDPVTKNPVTCRYAFRCNNHKPHNQQHIIGMTADNTVGNP